MVPVPKMIQLTLFLLVCLAIEKVFLVMGCFETGNLFAICFGHCAYAFLETFDVDGVVLRMFDWRKVAVSLMWIMMEGTTFRLFGVNGLVCLNVSINFLLHVCLFMAAGVYVHHIHHISCPYAYYYLKFEDQVSLEFVMCEFKHVSSVVQSNAESIHVSVFRDGLGGFSFQATVSNYTARSNSSAINIAGDRIFYDHQTKSAEIDVVEAFLTPDRLVSTRIQHIAVLNEMFSVQADDVQVFTRAHAGPVLQTNSLLLAYDDNLKNSYLSAPDVIRAQLALQDQAQYYQAEQVVYSDQVQQEIEAITAFVVSLCEPDAAPVKLNVAKINLVGSIVLKSWLPNVMPVVQRTANRFIQRSVKRYNQRVLPAVVNP